MDTPARLHPDGTYRYLPAGDAFSAGVAAEPGHAIIGLQFASHLPLAQALDVVDDEIERRGLPAASLVALHLRGPEVLTPEAFGAFNVEYLGHLERRGLLIDGASPLARTNVVPLFSPPAEAGVFAAFLVVPRDGASGDVVVAGATESVDGGIAAFGDVTPIGLREKSRVVVSVVLERLRRLEADGDAPTGIAVYSAHDVEDLPALFSTHLPASERIGYLTYPSRPPVLYLEFEVDCVRVSEWHVVGAR